MRARARDNSGNTVLVVQYSLQYNPSHEFCLSIPTILTKTELKPLYVFSYV